MRYDHRIRGAPTALLDVRGTLSVLERLADGSVEVVGFMADITPSARPRPRRRRPAGWRRWARWAPAWRMS